MSGVEGYDTIPNLTIPYHTREVLDPYRMSEKVESKLSPAAIFKKGLTYNGQWDKDSFFEYNDVVYWLRQIIGLLVGLVCGALPLTGAAGFATFAIAIVALPYFFYTNYSRINIEDFGPTTMLSEGLSQSFGVFVLTWIIVYSGMNF